MIIKVLVALCTLLFFWPARLVDAGLGCHQAQDVGVCVGWCSSGRFGNQLANFAYALYQAQSCCQPCVWTAKGQLQFINKANILDVPMNLSVVIGQCDATVCKEVTATRKRLRSNWPLFPPWHEVKQSLSTHLQPFLQGKGLPFPSDTLVIHLRGADVLGLGGMSIDYLPAPCSFYEHVLETRNEGKAFPKVRVVTDDAKHPCIPILMSRRVDMSFTSEINMKDDFFTLMNARSIALSTSSTFGLAAVVMSSVPLMNVFMPVFKGRRIASLEATFQTSRLSQLCIIGDGSSIYEIPAPAENPTDRRKWVVDYMREDISVMSSIHECKPRARAPPPTEL